MTRSQISGLLTSAETVGYFAAGAADFSGNRVESFLATGHDDHAGAFGGQLVGGGLANALGATGDDGDLAFESEFHVHSSWLFRVDQARLRRSFCGNMKQARASSSVSVLKV